MEAKVIPLEASGVTLEKLTSVYIKIRDKRSELSREFKQNDAALVEQQDKIKAALLDYCKENGIESARTDAGTFYRSLKTKYWTSDWESMYEFVIENNVPEFFTKSLNQTNVRTYLEEHPDVIPPGLNVESEYSISVTKPKKK